MGLFGKTPELASSAFIAPSASIIGDVSIGEKSSVWYNSVLRGKPRLPLIGMVESLEGGEQNIAKRSVSM